VTRAVTITQQTRTALAARPAYPPVAIHA